MNDIWPTNLIEELAYRRCVLFLGSGISATSTNDAGESPDTWEDFLSNVKGLIKNPTPEDISFVDEMLHEKNYLMALQAIYDLCDTGEYSDYLKRMYRRKNYNPSPIHQIIKDLDSKLVITTNFDKIYETACNQQGYAVFDYTQSKSIVGCLKSPENIIIKAHGSIDDTEKIVFTAQQYYKTQEKYPDFYRLLSALFLTHTVIFLGYSLQDPDINLVLQFLHNTANTSCPHYLVTTSGNKKQLVQHWRNTYNVSLIEYGDDLSSFQSSLEELRDEVIELREERGMP